MIETLHDLQLTHPIITLVTFHALLALSRSPLLGAAVPLAFYWGREMRDAELLLDLPSMDGWQVFFPTSWPWQAQRDFWPVLAVAAVLWVVWTLVGRRSRLRHRMEPAIPLAEKD